MSVVLSLQPQLSWQESLKVEILISVTEEIPFEWGDKSIEQVTQEEVVKLMAWTSSVLKKPLSDWTAPGALDPKRFSALFKEAFYLKIQEVATVHLEILKVSLMCEFVYKEGVRQIKVAVSGKGEVQLDKVKTLNTPELVIEYLNSLEQGEEEKEIDEDFVIVNPKKPQIPPALKKLKKEIALLETWIKNPALIPLDF